jgi:hypothetical protein
MGQVQNHVINPAVMTDAMLGYLDRHPEQAEHAAFEANSTFTSSCSTRSSQGRTGEHDVHSSYGVHEPS